jgi:hypothetical protein
VAGFGAQNCCPAPNLIEIGTQNSQFTGQLPT